MYRDERDAWVERIKDDVDFNNAKYIVLKETDFAGMFERKMIADKFYLDYDEVQDIIEQYKTYPLPYKYNSNMKVWYRIDENNMYRILSYLRFAYFFCDRDIEWGPQNTEMQQILNGLLLATGVESRLPFALYYSIKLYNMRIGTLNPTAIELVETDDWIGGKYKEIRFKSNGSTRLVLAKRMEVPEPLARPE